MTKTHPCLRCLRDLQTLCWQVASINFGKAEEQFEFSLSSKLFALRVLSFQSESETWQAQVGRSGKFFFFFILRMDLSFFRHG